MKQKAFTLIEVLVLIGIIGTIIALILPAISAVRGKEVTTVVLDRREEPGKFVQEDGKTRWIDAKVVLVTENGEISVPPDTKAEKGERVVVRICCDGQFIYVEGAEKR